MTASAARRARRAAAVPPGLFDPRLEDELFLEVMRGRLFGISRREFGDLGNYSATLPTGTRVGKVWRCAVIYERQEPEDDWLLCCYHDLDGPARANKVGICRTPVHVETPRETQVRVVDAALVTPEVPEIRVLSWREEQVLLNAGTRP